MSAVLASPFAGEPPVLAATLDVLGRRDDGGLAWLAVSQPPIRAAGGGQPADRGWLVAEGGERFAVQGVRKTDGLIWIAIDPATALELGDQVELEVDAAARLLYARAHTLTHVMMASLRKELPGFDSRGADISATDGAARLRFTAGEVLDQAVEAALVRARQAINGDLPVRVVKARSVEAAQRDYPLFRMDPDLSLGGKVRLIDIPGVDTNPCSGSHVGRLGLIGAGFEADPVEALEGRYRMTVRLPDALP